MGQQRTIQKWCSFARTLRKKKRKVVIMCASDFSVQIIFNSEKSFINTVNWCFCINISVNTFFCPCVWCLCVVPLPFYFHYFVYLRALIMRPSTAECGHYTVRPVAPLSSSAGNTTPWSIFYSGVMCWCQWTHIINRHKYILCSALESQISFSKWLILHAIIHSVKRFK